MENDKITCPNCKGVNVVKRGTFKTKLNDKQQRYFCKDCNKKFIPRTAFYRMRNSPDKITQTLNLYFSGVSLRKSQAHLGVFYPHNASYVSILHWIRKYCNMIGNYVDTLKVENSEKISFDEMEYKTKGKQSFFIDVIDMDTRFILSSGYYYNRGMDEMREVLRRAKQKSLNKVMRFDTDGLKIYPQALWKEYRFNPKRSSAIHKVTKSTDKAFNWKIERLHNNIRERTKIMRQFNQIDSAKAIMKGYEIFYNFCRKHQAIKCYPYELAIPELKLGVNKWLDLINLSNPFLLE